MLRGTRALIFDFDGVIADSETLHYETFTSVLAEEGILMTREVNDREYVGIDVTRSFEKAFESAGRGLDPGMLSRLVARKSALFKAGIERIRVFPGIRALIDEGASRFPCALVSGTLRVEIQEFLRRHALDGRFAAIVAADDGVPSKPAPGGYLRALDLLRRDRIPDLSAFQCVVLEDSVPGIRAARSAGMRCVGLAHSHPPYLLAEADMVLESAAEWDWALIDGCSQSPRRPHGASKNGDKFG